MNIIKDKDSFINDINVFTDDKGTINYIVPLSSIHLLNEDELKNFLKTVNIRETLIFGTKMYFVMTIIKEAFMPYSLYNDFDADKHKETYVDYLEVIIDENGVIMYAVPSYTEKMIRLLNMTKDEFFDSISIFDSPLNILMKKTNCISVWNKFFKGKANIKQLNALRLLKMKGIYKGPIHNR